MTIAGKKKITRNFFLSLLIHAVVLALLATAAVRVYKKNFAAIQSADSSTGSTSDKPAIDHKTVKQALEKEEANAAELPDEKKMAELRRKADTLASMDAQAVDAVASTVETVKNADRLRAYEPRKNVSGEFDPTTAILYDICRENRDEQPIFVYTLVDAKGRSTKAERKMDEMSADDMRAYQIFEMGRNNKNMARLLRSAIMIGQPQTPGTSRKITN